MKELEQLKELYLEEIKKISKKGELTPADAEAAKKALEAIEKIDKICCDEADYMEGEYSERMYPRRSMPEMYQRRGRSSTTGRYISRNNGSTIDHMIHKLEDMRMDAPDSETRMAISRAINELEAY